MIVDKINSLEEFEKTLYVKLENQMTKEESL
jgi:hypothetical protein